MSRTISIAMCTYNGAAFVEEQLKSFSAQTRLPDELVIFDDRSSDGTVEIAKAYAASAPFPVRIEVNEENLGSNRNFERAVRACKGDLIALADQDDVWMPEKLAVLEQALVKRPEAAFVFSDAEVVDSALMPLGYRLWESSSVEFSPFLRWRFRLSGGFSVLLKRYIVTGATMLFRAEMQDAAAPFPEKWVHDGWIAFCACALGWKGAFVERPLMFYRQHESQQIGARRPQRGEILRKVAKRLTRRGMEKRGTLRRSEAFKEFFTEQIEQYGQALTALEKRKDKALDSKALERSLIKIRAKILHMEARRAIAEESSIRTALFRIMMEFVQGRYFQYSPSDWFSVLGDLMFLTNIVFTRGS